MSSFSLRDGAVFWSAVAASFFLLIPGVGFGAPPTSVRSNQLDNWFAYIPPACYVDTRSEGETVHNPCFTCHTRGRAPNYIDDSDLQLNYSFPAPARVNPWRNLWKDRRIALRGISDEEMSSYVASDNYRSVQRIIVADTLRSHMPPEWDSNGNGQWDGYVPDVYYNLDAEGFDRDPEGNYSGWKQYHYAPFPGNFSPINGSVGDAFIRLGEDLLQNVEGNFDLAVYRVNLAIVEATVRQRDIEISTVDEKVFGVDLDKSGGLNTAHTIAFSAEPGEMKLVGRAGRLQASDKIHLEAGLFPEFTEFFHTLRYLQVTPDGEVTHSPRMKEVRHAIKKRWYTPAQLSRFANDETKEKAYTPDRPRWVRGNQEYGVSNALAWQYHGFIEDSEGNLRPQTHEELVFCVGCHSGIGATTDSNFSFARKLGDSLGNYLLGNGSTAEYGAAPDVDDLLEEFAASVNNTSARVSSARVRRPSLSIFRFSTPRPTGPSDIPTRMNTRAPLTGVRSRPPLTIL